MSFISKRLLSHFCFESFTTPTALSCVSVTLPPPLLECLHLVLALLLFSFFLCFLIIHYFSFYSILPAILLLMSVLVTLSRLDLADIIPLRWLPTRHTKRTAAIRTIQTGKRITIFNRLMIFKNNIKSVE